MRKQVSFWVAFLLAGTMAFAMFASLAIARDCEPHLKIAERAYINRMLRSIHSVLADDAFQEAMISYHRKCLSGEVIANPFGWLLAASRNKLLNLMRDERRKIARDHKAYEESQIDRALGVKTYAFPAFSPAPIPLSDPENFKKIHQEQLLSNDASPLLYGVGQELAKSLNQDQARALYGRYVEGKTFPEIANQELVPVTTVQSRLRSGERAISDVVTSTRPAIEASGWTLEEFWTAVGTIGFVILIAAGVLCGIPSFSETRRKNEEWEEFIHKRTPKPQPSYARAPAVAPLLTRNAPMS